MRRIARRMGKGRTWMMLADMVVVGVKGTMGIDGDDGRKLERWTSDCAPGLLESDPQ